MTKTKTKTKTKCALVLEPMYRGARVPGPPSGPSYFVSVESFAATYGPTEKFSLCLKKPLEVSPDEWDDYASSAYTESPTQIAAKLKKRGYDSVVSRRPMLGGKEFVVAFTTNTKPATTLAGLRGSPVSARRKRRKRR